MSFKHSKIVDVIFVLLIIASVSSCIRSNKKVILSFSKGCNLVPVIKSTEQNQVAKNSNLLILYVEDAECSMCLAELALWNDILERSKNQFLQYKIVFKECSDVTLKYNLDILGIDNNIYWDSNAVLEEEIALNRLKHTILIDKQSQLIKSFDREGLNECEIIESINEIKNMELDSEQ